MDPCRDRNIPDALTIGGVEDSDEKVNVVTCGLRNTTMHRPFRVPLRVRANYRSRHCAKVDGEAIDGLDAIDDTGAGRRRERKSRGYKAQSS